MAKLINGNGNPAVYANEDSDWFAAIMGNQTSITAIGEQFRADQADANTIEVFDGVIITKEGRRIQLDANQVDLFEIPTGTQGQTNYYIIGYHLYTDTDANQFCEVFVQLMESASDTIPEDTFRGGADDVYISLYRVTQDGLNIDSIDLLLPTISTISKINADLSNAKSTPDYNNAISWTATPQQAFSYTAPSNGVLFIKYAQSFRQYLAFSVDGVAVANIASGPIGEDSSSGTITVPLAEGNVISCGALFSTTILQCVFVPYK